MKGILEGIPKPLCPEELQALEKHFRSCPECQKSAKAFFNMPILSTFIPAPAMEAVGKFLEEYSHE